MGSGASAVSVSDGGCDQFENQSSALSLPMAQDLGRIRTTGHRECDNPTALALTHGFRRSSSFETEREARHKEASLRALSSKCSLWERIGASNGVGNQLALNNGLADSIKSLLPLLDAESREQLEAWALRPHASRATLCSRSIVKAVQAARHSDAIEAAVRNARERVASRLSIEDRAIQDGEKAAVANLVCNFTSRLKVVKETEPPSPRTQVELPKSFADKTAASSSSHAEKHVRPKPNPRDFILRGHKGERLVRSPGQIDGYDFHIEDCHGCCIFILDHSLQVMIDRCTDCQILLGAVEGSVFVRECTSCVFRAACGQLRTRDCTQCDFLLWIPGHPIIETSLDLRFGPFGNLPGDGAYAEQWGHLQRAGLSEFEGEHWARIVDFSPEWQAESVHGVVLREDELVQLMCDFPVVAGQQPQTEEPCAAVAAADSTASGEVPDTRSSAVPSTPKSSSPSVASRHVRLEPLASNCVLHEVNAAEPVLNDVKDKRCKDSKKKARRRARAAEGTIGICNSLMRQLQFHPESDTDHKGILAVTDAAEIVAPHLTKISSKLDGQYDQSFLALISESFLERALLERSIARTKSPLERAMKLPTNSFIAALVARAESQTRWREDEAHASPPILDDQRLDALLRADLLLFQKTFEANVLDVAINLLTVERSWSQIQTQNDTCNEHAVIDDVLRCLEGKGDMAKALLPCILSGHVSSKLTDSDLADRIFSEARREALDGMLRQRVSEEDVSEIQQEVRGCVQRKKKKMDSNFKKSAPSALRGLVESGEHGHLSERDKLHAFFQQCDLNGNGSLSVKELRTVLKRLGLHLSSSEVTALLSDADVNLDGEIDFEEFVTWLYGGTNSSRSRDDPRKLQEDRPKHAQHNDSATHQDDPYAISAAISYEAFATARNAIKQRSGMQHLLPHLSACTFLALDRGPDSQVCVESLLRYITCRADVKGKFTNLSTYDSTGSGNLSELDAERFIADFASLSPFLSNQMQKEFIPFYLMHATRRLFFYLDKRNRGRISIRELVCSPIVAELEEVGHASSLDLDQIRQNWFSLDAALRVYSKFNELDTDRDGILSLVELSKAGSGFLSPDFLSLLLEVVPTFSGGLDYKGFLNFMLAYENIQSPQAIRYFWRALSGGGVAKSVSANSLRPLLGKVLQMIGNGYETFNTDIVLQELWDMIGCSCEDTCHLTVRLCDLLEHRLGGTFLHVVIDALAFWRYDNRESLAQHHEEE